MVMVITLLEHLFKSICLTVVSGEARKADTAGEISWENNGELHWLKVKLHNVKMPRFPIKYFIRVVMIHTYLMHSVREKVNIGKKVFTPWYGGRSETCQDVCKSKDQVRSVFCSHGNQFVSFPSTSSYRRPLAQYMNSPKESDDESSDDDDFHTILKVGSSRGGRDAVNF